MNDQMINLDASAELAQSGIIMLWEPITPESCEKVAKQIIAANINLNKEFDKIQLIINSPGGDLYAAFSLVDVIMGSNVPVHTLGIGLVASAGLMLFMSGDKGNRTITPNTMMLSHQWSGGVHGKEHDLVASYREIEMFQELVLRHYKKCTKLPISKIKKYLLPPSDVWLTPSEAVTLNIADEIVDPSNKWKEVT